MNTVSLNWEKRKKRKTHLSARTAERWVSITPPALNGVAYCQERDIALVVSPA